MKKTLITILVTVLLCGCVFGTTFAWLMDKTEPIENTFTFGNIDIELKETGATNNKQSFKMMPGATIEKDPTVTVKAGSEACWLFVKIDEANNTFKSTEKFVTYNVVTTGEKAWKELQYGVYYIEVDAATATTGATYPVLVNNQVTVNQNATANDFTGTAPTLTFTAYAVQKDTTVDTAAEAWSIATTGNLPNT